MPDVSPKARELLRRIASRKSAEAASMADSIWAALAAEIPAYARIRDPALIEDVRSVAESVVHLWLDVLCEGRPLTSEVLEPVVEGARRRARQGIELYSVLRAYRVGMRVLWHELMAASEWQQPGLQGLLLQLPELALDFAERTSTDMAAGYVDEANRLAREREQQRSHLLDVILAGSSGDVGDAPPEVRAPHVVVALQTTEDVPLQRLEVLGRAVETVVGARLWTLRHRSVIGVLPAERSRDRDHLLADLAPLAELRGVQAIGIGGHAEAPPETHQSYLEALDAVRVGSVLKRSGATIHDFQEFAALIALAAQPEQARRFVTTALQPLGDLASRPWLPATLEAYILRQGRLKEAAALLGVHLNTVKYRLNEMRESIGPLLADGDRAAMLLLAIRLQRLLEAAGYDVRG